MAKEIAGLGKSAKEIGTFMTNLDFVVGPKVKKKFCRKTYEKKIIQSAMLMGVDLLQTILVTAREISDTSREEERFDLLVGDLEAMLVGLKNEFDKNYNTKYPFREKCDILDIKERVKHWYVKEEKINQEASEEIVH